MADVEIEDRDTALLPRAHRVVRSLDSAEGPFAGALVTRGDGVAVRVDAASLAGWVGWHFAGAEHVVGPVDVIRRADGHDVLLPWCTDQVLGFLVRRTAAGSRLSSGECSTLVVSMLRGLDEVGEGVDGMQTGVWWLTDGGRPTFVIGAGDDARAGAATIVERLTEECGDKALERLLRAVHQGLTKALSHPRVPRPLLEGWERELLAIAAPRPLGRETYAPERARDMARAAVAGPGDRRSSRARPARRGSRPASGRRPPAAHRAPATRRPPAAHRAAGGQRMRERSGGAGMVAAVASAFAAIGMRLRGHRIKDEPRPKEAGASTPSDRSRTTRRRALIFAGAAAAVLAGGLLWPGEDTAESADRARGGGSSAQPSDRVAADPEDEPKAGVIEAGGAAEDGKAPRTPAADGARPEIAASALLAVIAGCGAAQDTVCAEAVAQGSAGVIDALATLGDGAPTVELVDEYGDVAVVRVGSPGGSVGEEGQPPSEPDQMLVLVRQDEKWLVRDVYGVADQPG